VKSTINQTSGKRSPPESKAFVLGLVQLESFVAADSHSISILAARPSPNAIWQARWPTRVAKQSAISSADNMSADKSGVDGVVNLKATHTFPTYVTIGAFFKRARSQPLLTGTIRGLSEMTGIAKMLVPPARQHSSKLPCATRP